MIDKSLVVQLVKETQERIEAQLQKEKMQRMQAFAKEDQTIDTNGVLAFALSEAKLFTTLFVSDLLMTIAEYDELDKKIAAGSTSGSPQRGLRGTGRPIRRNRTPRHNPYRPFRPKGRESGIFLYSGTPPL